MAKKLISIDLSPPGSILILLNLYYSRFSTKANVDFQSSPKERSMFLNVDYAKFEIFLGMANEI